MIKASTITKDGRDFRVIVGDVFSANNDFKAMLCIEADADADWDLFKSCEGLIVQCYVLGETVNIPIEYGEAVEGSDSYIVIYVGNDYV